MRMEADIRAILVGSVATLAVPTMAADAPVGVALGWGDLAQLFAGLGLVVAMIVALAWALRRLGGVRAVGTGSLEVLGGLSVGPRERVVLLRVGTRQLVIGVAPGRVQTLDVLDEPVTTSPVGNDGFAARLQRALSARSDS